MWMREGGRRFWDREEAGETADLKKKQGSCQGEVFVVTMRGDKEGIRGKEERKWAGGAT